jgi:hypothetical protein
VLVADEIGIMTKVSAIPKNTAAPEHKCTHDVEVPQAEVSQPDSQWQFALTVIWPGNSIGAACAAIALKMATKANSAKRVRRSEIIHLAYEKFCAVPNTSPCKVGMGQSNSRAVRQKAVLPGHFP